MLLFLSFFILDFVAAKIYGRERIRQITSESSFEDFKLAVIRDDFVRNAVKSVHSDETSRNLVDKLSRVANISELIAVSETHRMPIQRLLYEWNYVPAQDSPKHILNALNNDCIQEILRKLTDPSDFLSAAETCRGFQANALECFPRNFEELSLSLGNKSVGCYTALPLEHAPNFLNIFGHLIWYMELISDFEDGTINMIAEHCGETLFSMHIKGHENAKSNFNELSLFKTLTDIDISSISMDNVELPENLEWIHLNGVKVQADLQCIMKKFPKLEIARFDKVDNLNDTAFNAFIMLNPQIEMLDIFGSQNLSFSAINSISDRLPNLVHLSIDCMALATHEYSEIVMHFKQFQQLRHLEIYVDFDLFIPAVTTIDSLATNIPTIETLRLVGFHNFDQTLPGLLQLYELKVLKVACSDFVSLDTILELVQVSFTLKQIHFNCFTINVSEIMNILEYGKNLNELDISIRKMDMDLSVYNSILALIKGRLEVILRITDGNIDENIFEQNMQQLKIVRRG